MSDQVMSHSLDVLDIKLVMSGITYVEVPFDTSWRILPYTVLTTVRKTPGEDAGSSLLEFADGSTEIFAPGTTVLIPRDVKHRFTNTRRPHTAVWIHWDVVLSPCVDLFSFCEIPRTIQGEQSRRIMEFCREIALCPLAELEGVVKMKSLLYSLLGVVLQVCRLKEAYDNFRLHHLAYIPLLSYIDQNIHRRIALADAAKFQKCSVSKLQRDFLSVFGVPIGEFIIERRLNQATRYLYGWNLNLAEIAERVGFSDAFSLSKSFKKCFDLSPNEYRKLARRQGGG